MSVTVSVAKINVVKHLMKKEGYKMFIDICVIDFKRSQILPMVIKYFPFVSPNITAFVGY